MSTLPRPCGLRGIWLGAALTLAACISGPQTEPLAPQQFIVPASFDETWSAVLIWFTDFNIPIETIDRASGFLRSREMVLETGIELAGYGAGDLFDCGSEVGIARTFSGTTFFVITTLLQPAGADGTTIRVQLAAHNYEEEALGPNDVQCVSRGVLEPLIPEMVLQNVGQGH